MSACICTLPYIFSCVKCAQAIVHICTTVLSFDVYSNPEMPNETNELKYKKNDDRICHLSTTTLHDNHSTTDRKLACVNLSVTYPQAICRKMPITQSFKVSNWGPSVWICYSDSGMKTICSAAACYLLFKGSVVLIGWMLTLWFSVLLLN